MYRRILISIFLLIFLSSCAHKIIHESREPSGELVPDPMFMFQTLDKENPIRITFFYTLETYEEDLDGILVSQKTFLDPRQPSQFIDADSDVKLTMRVGNPGNRQYIVYVKQIIEYDDGSKTDSLRIAGESIMRYREYQYVLPTRTGIQKVSYLVQLAGNAGQPLITTKGIMYHIIPKNLKRGGGK